MLIHIDTLKKEIKKNFYGGEKDTEAYMFVDEMNRIMYGKLKPGASIGLHTHETSSEIIYIIQGNGIVVYDNLQEELKAGMCHYCPKGHTHSFINNSQEDLLFFAVVSQQ